MLTADAAPNYVIQCKSGINSVSRTPQKACVVLYDHSRKEVGVCMRWSEKTALSGNKACLPHKEPGLELVHKIKLILRNAKQ